MKISGYLLTFITLSFGFLATGNATVTIQFAGGFLKDRGPGNVANGSGTLLLVASTGDSLFTAPSATSSLTVGSAISSGSDDIVLFKSAISGDGDQSGSPDAGEFRQLTGALTLGTAGAGTVAAGDALILYWFPTVSSSQTSLAYGSDYGAYRSSITSGMDGDGSRAWYVPADGSSAYSLLFLTRDAGSSINTGTSGIPFGQAEYTVVPEPSTVLGGLVLTVVGSGIGLRRRTRSAVISRV